jgi:hypothetical protein
MASLSKTYESQNQDKDHQEGQELQEVYTGESRAHVQYGMSLATHLQNGALTGGSLIASVLVELQGDDVD